MDTLHPVEELMMGGSVAPIPIDLKSVAKFAGHHHSKGHARTYTKQDHMAFKKRVAKRRKKK